MRGHSKTEHIIGQIAFGIQSPSLCTTAVTGIHAHWAALALHIINAERFIRRSNGPSELTGQIGNIKIRVYRLEEPLELVALESW